MPGAAEDAAFVLPDGRVLEYAEGGDPEGRPMIFQPGTPVTRVGRWGHGAAAAAGVRLVTLNRPGHGGSTTPNTRPDGHWPEVLAGMVGIWA